MWRQLRDVFGELGASDQVRAIVLTGAGDHFCAGADIGEFETRRGDVAAGEAYEREVDAAVEVIASSPRATIAAVAGWSVGGGCGLALACDFRLAHASARFFIPAARMGIVYGVPDTRNLLALVGLSHARRMLLAGQRLDATQALAAGLVDEVVEAGVEDAARRLATDLAEHAPLSIAGAKLILRALVRGEVTGRQAEIDAAIAHSLESADYHEAVRAFRDKRPPRFTGR